MLNKQLSHPKFSDLLEYIKLVKLPEQPSSQQKSVHVQLFEYFLPNFENYISIVANGEFPADLQIIQAISHSQVIIACDGAANQLNEHYLNANYIIGDGDSIDYQQDRLKQDNYSKCEYIINRDQNTNDLTKAINLVADKFGMDVPVLIFAATGLREDHSLANIFLLEQYASRFTQVAMISDYGIFQVIKNKNRLPTIIGQQISLFCTNNQASIACPNLKWPLNNYRLNYLNSGSLNQATSDYLVIQSLSPVIVYRAFCIKN